MNREVLYIGRVAKLTKPASGRPSENTNARCAKDPAHAVAVQEAAPTAGLNERTVCLAEDNESYVVGKSLRPLKVP
ncbi:hypothetical protein EDC14_102628 [Hydrogenispora ethanolica]|jgi:hypothetical protein|uniref:Uncharacterized protein n=1 Tax=Hydrogenispora ethanolica TaxID=1082276 RepID=A0A4R1R9D3_HYDET|nr:hypothetical protein [Hydrogenispora ethanolica]TCL62285.1 hypothetical protein EDC14_102628 [Hydrogenispora ethanolica]